MRIKTLMITVSLALFFLAMPQATRAQKDGEAQAVIFDGTRTRVALMSCARLSNSHIECAAGDAGR
jgi:hypothetical protein